MAGRQKTKYRGVYERIAEQRTWKGKPDVAFDITFRFQGKKIWEKVGWLSEGYTAQLAADVLAERIRSKRHGDELPQQKKIAVTFQKLAEKYLKWSEQNKNRNGIEDKSRYEKHLKARFDNKRLDEITLLDLERLKRDMTNDGKSPKTIAHCLALIRAMYNKAIDGSLTGIRYNGENPVKKKRPGEKKGIMPIVKNARDRFLTVSESEILLKELKRNHQKKNEYIELEDPKLHDMALISLHTGARAGEIFNLKGQDADFQNELTALRDTKNTETRYAPMTEDVKKILEKRKPDDLNAYFFTNKDGGKIKEVSNAFQQIVNKLGFNDGIEDARQRVVFHTLRHTFASWLAIQGTPLYTIAKLMGHKSIAMSERYAHLSPDHKREAVNAVASTLKKNK
ncbi:MAG TPA: site-specific integrase [Smithella sp.]|nr:site-specific integrase [Smithella sp.]